MKELKKILSVLLCVVMVFGSAPLAGIVGLELPEWLSFDNLFYTKAEAATSGSCGLNLRWSFDTSTYVLTITGTGTMTDYSSSSSVPWYDYRYSIKSVSLPDGLTSIGDYAFCRCEGVKSITIPDGVTSIGDAAFEFCYTLESITIPYGVTSIGNNAFDDCSRLTSVTLPDSVTSIGGAAFAYCSRLESIIIPDSVKSIEKNTFYRCESLTSITIPDGVTSIGYYCFYGCYSLESIIIPDSVTSIGDNALYSATLILCSKGSYTYEYAENNSVAYYLIDGTEEDNTISGMVGTKLAWKIDRETRKLTINNDGVMVSFTSEDAPWQQYKQYILSVEISNGCKNIGDSAFEYCSYLKIVDIPDSVTSIGYRAFYHCDKLTSITIGNSVTSIGEYAFSSCDGLTSVTIPNSVTTIGEYAFYSCDDLTSVTIGNSVTSIGNYAFYSCDSLTSIEMPDGVTSIGDNSFRNCTSLTSITVPDSVIRIGCGAFRGCTSLESITLPFIGDCRGGSETERDVFGYIFGYTDDSSYKDSTVSQCYDYYGTIKYYYYFIPSSLNTVIITDETVIPYSAFYNCENIKTITFPDTVTSIGEYAFGGTSGIKTLYYSGTLAEWDDIDISYTGNSRLRNAEKYSTYYAIFDAAGGTFSDGEEKTSLNMKLSNVVLPSGNPTREGYTFDCWYPEIPETVPKHNLSFIALWIPEHEHETTRYNAVEPTCSADGHTGYIFCETCNEIVDYGEAIPAYGHDYDVQIMLKPTCAEKGSKTFTCLVCSDSYTEEIEATGNHNYFGKVTTPPTCTEKGIEIFTCSVCDDAYTEDIEATGHNYVGEVTTQPTCTEKGVKTFTCSICDETYTEDMEATGHNYVGEITTQPTCTEKGVKTFNCSDCGDSYTEELDKTPHTYEHSIVSVPTETEKGTVKHTCIVCGNTYTASTGSKLEKYTLEIDNYADEITVGYGDKLVLTATATGLPSAAKIVWFVGDTEHTEGNKLEIASIQSSVTVTVKAVDTNGNVIMANNVPVIDTVSVATATNINHFLNYTVTDCKATITASKSTISGAVTIPSSIEGYPVIKIGMNAFGFRYNITSVTVSKGIKEIGDDAFAGSYNIKTINLPESVVSIGDSAFFETGISSISLSRNVTSIGNGAFQNCVKLTSLIIPEGVTKIENNTFYQCTNLASVTIPESVKSIGNNAFYYCNKLSTVNYGGTQEQWNAITIGTENTYLSSASKSYGMNRAIFDANGGSFSSGNTYVAYYNRATALLTVPSNPTRSGYVFKGWVPEASQGSSFMPNYDITIYASWAPAHEHGTVILNQKYPDCENEGHTGYCYCETCNDFIGIGDVLPAEGHHYDAGEVTKEPTCTETGKKTYCCVKCKINISEEIPALGHSYDSGAVTTEPNCTEIGITTFTCTACGDIYTEDMEALGHSYSSSLTKVPTCTEEGEMTYTCSACGDSYTNPINKRPHSYSETIVNKEATCTEDGEETFTCTACNTIFTNTIPAIGHNYDDGVVTKVATCTEKGVMTFTCANCGDTYTEDIGKLGHIEVVDEAVSPSCTQTGLTKGSHCERCGEVFTERETVPATGHLNYGEWQISVNSTCTSEGEKYRICGDCGYTEYQNIDFAEHSWNDKYTVDKEPACTADGSKSIHCLECSATKDSVVIPATGHTEVVQDTVAPGCTKTGLTEGKYCSVCGEVLIEQETVPATGHLSFGEWQISVNSTCTSEGEEFRVCADCGYAEHRNIELAEHSWDNKYTVDREPTCTTDGMESIHCSKCSAIRNSMTIPASGHTEVIDSAIAPTYESTGLTEGKHCSACGTVIVAQQTVAKLTAPTLKIRNNHGSTTLDYGNSIKFTAEVANHPGGAKIYWYVDGAKKGEGTTFTLTEPQNSVTVTVKLVDASGNAIKVNGFEIGDTEEVKVNNGFFQKIIAFFKKLFGLSKTITQAFKDTI